MPQPDEPTRIGNAEQSNTSIIVGESAIGHTPMGSELGLVTGEAFDVKVKPTVERRERVTPNGARWRTTMRYVVTNGTTSNGLGFGVETVLRSPDGLHWTPTAGQPTDQDEATTDVDIVAMPNGRVLTSELDYAGINFITGPSRTADIELTLTRGVHGPKEVHAVFVDEPLGPSA